MLRILIAGGRDLQPDLVARWLNEHLTGPLVVIHGDARGADQGAVIFGAGRAEVIPFPADWEKHGRAAGAIRNRQMLVEGKPDLVIAFPGGRGTADCCKQAREHGVAVLRAALGPRRLPPPRRPGRQATVDRF
jgi:hypothetical protein